MIVRTVNRHSAITITFGSHFCVFVKTPPNPIYLIPQVFSKNSKLFCSSPVYLIPRLPLSSCGVFFVANLPLCRRRPFQKTYSPQKPRIRASSGTNHADIAQYLLLFRICQHLSINTTFFLTLPWSFCYVLSIISIL